MQMDDIIYGLKNNNLIFLYITRNATVTSFFLKFNRQSELVGKVTGREVVNFLYFHIYRIPISFSTIYLLG